ncbi:MAG: thiamine phosphate synthase [Candidatus Limnocylindrales bacterium]
MTLRDDLRLYLIADTGICPPDRLAASVAAALRGGVTCVQLRAKAETTAAQVRLARELAELCAGHGVPFIVNDRADVALVSGANGLHVGHVGQEDLHPADARRLVGPDRIVGVSVGSAAEARSAAEAGASYVSAGPMLATRTKSDAGPPAGVALLRAVRAAVDLPFVVIGGIGEMDAASWIMAGADGICVASAILAAADPEGAAGRFRAAVRAAR